MKRVLAIILGGGAGTRLYPLTKLRAKPAVPLGAKYRLIDIPISNCINSEIPRIYVLTQFNSASLNRHIARTYAWAGAGFSPGFVEVLAAQQTPDSPHWFQGTADAVRQYLGLFAEWDVDQYLILSGDQLYRMNYAHLLQRHRETKAAITLGVVPVEARRASDFGLLRIDSQGRVRAFSEKPTGEALQAMQVDTTVLGLSAGQAQAAPYIASMGIYVFDKQVLHALLTQAPAHTDFGKDILPPAASDHNVQAYLFQEYWEDIGTIEAFYHANLALTEQPDPPFSFYDEQAPIYTRSRYLPPTKLLDAHVRESMLGEGCILKECTVQRSVIGLRARIETGCVIENTLLMGADYYESPAQREDHLEHGTIPLGVGAHTTIRHAIVDKNARIGRQVRIVNHAQVQEADQEALGFVIRHGIVVVIKNATIPDGMVI
jgi:glucose-1-phosphate adenylyltransferase